MVLEVQGKHVEATREDWLQVYENQFALYKDGKLVGMYESLEDATDAGLKRVDFQPFLIRRERKKAESVVLVDQLSGGTGPRID